MRLTNMVAIVRFDKHCRSSNEIFIELDLVYVSWVTRKPVFGVSDRSYTNPAVRLQKMIRDLKFRSWDKEGLYYM